MNKLKTVTWRDSSLVITQTPVDGDWYVETITSVGFLIHEDKEMIVLAGDLLNDNQDARRVITIPKENIISIK